MYELWFHYTPITMVTVYYRNDKGENKVVLVRTYKEVKRRMNAFMLNSFDENVSVFRKRRGQWGEWFENWSRIGGKAKIIREGWQ
jgi:hypothetical protein